MSLRHAAVQYCLILVTASSLASLGCSRSTLRKSERPTSRPVGDLGTGFFEPRVEAFVIPPTGWELDTPKIDDDRAHLTWLSPSRDTAYGIVYFPIPAGVAWLPKGEFFHGQAADRYIEEFKKDTGDAIELSREWDNDLDGMRIVAEGGPYKARSILRVRGKSGWSVYSGTLRDQEVNEKELALSEKAREATQIGRDAEGGADAAEAMLE